MAITPFFPKWTWEPLADRFGLDSVCVYPFYCLYKYYSQAPPFENIFVDEVGTYEYAPFVPLIVRIEKGELQKPKNHVVFTIDYTRPKKWYKSWLDKWRIYQYDRTVIVEIDEPEVCFNGYCYYLIWFGRENVSGLKSIKYEIE